MLGPCALLMYKLMRTCLNRLDLTGLKVSGDQLKTGVFFELLLHPPDCMLVCDFPEVSLEGVDTQDALAILCTAVVMD